MLGMYGKILHLLNSNTIKSYSKALNFLKEKYNPRKTAIGRGRKERKKERINMTKTAML